jgi:hypothetical protein
MSMLSNIAMKEMEDPFVIRTWERNKGSSTIILSLPHELARKYGIKVHTNLLAIDTGESIILKKLEVKE